MAWIRTALSLIAFGFGVGKIHDYFESVGREIDPIASMRIFAVGFITLGVLALFAAVIQHMRLLRRLESRDFVYLAPWPIGLITAIMLLLSLTIGHLLGGPGRAQRSSLATASIARNIGLAFYIASLSKVGHSFIPTLLAYTLLGALVAVPYAVWSKRQMN